MATKRQAVANIERLADILLRLRVVTRPESARTWAARLAAEGVEVPPKVAREPEVDDNDPGTSEP